MTSQWPKKQNHEKLRPSKTPTQTKNAATGHRIKINDIIGFSSSIMSIFSISTSGERTESSSPWPPSSRREKPSSAEAIIKRWKRSTDTSQKFSWVSGYKTITQTTLTWFSPIWKRRAMTWDKSASCRPRSWSRFLRHRAHNKSNPKRCSQKRLKQKWLNHK